MKKTAFILFSWVLVAAMVVGCSQNAPNSSHSVDKTQVSTSKIQSAVVKCPSTSPTKKRRVQKDDHVQSFARFFVNETGTYGNAIKYSSDELGKVAEAIKKANIDEAFLPKIGIAGDYLMEIRINKGRHGVQLVYPHFGVSLANHPIEPFRAVKKKPAKLKVGPGHWMITKSGGAYLRVHLNKTFVVIDSAKMGRKELFKKIAESLTPTKEILPIQK